MKNAKLARSIPRTVKIVLMKEFMNLSSFQTITLVYLLVQRAIMKILLTTAAIFVLSTARFALKMQQTAKNVNKMGIFNPSFFLPTIHASTTAHKVIFKVFCSILANFVIQNA